MGLGTRNLFGNLDKSPSPAEYNIRSSLEINTEKGRGVKIVPKTPIPVIILLMLATDYYKVSRTWGL
jgi:hypothetical protein